MKKLLSCLLAAVMLFTGLSVAVYAEDVCDCGHAPIVFIDGFNARDLIQDEGTDDERVVFPFAADAIPNMLKDNIETVWDLLDTRFDAVTEQTVADAIKDLLNGTEMTDEGMSLYDVTVDWDYPTDPAHSEGQYFKYQYDWRLDPFISAEGLKDFIAYIKELTGHDTVHLIGFSQGATVLNTYLSQYGYDGLETVIWYCGAHNGTSLAGSLFAGGMRFDAASVTGYVQNATDDTFLFNTLAALLQGLTDIGVTGGVLDLVNKSLETFYADGVMQDIFLSTFGKMPGVWSLVPYEDYEDAKKFIFGEGEEAAPYAALIEKLDRYHNEVQANSDAIVRAAQEQVGKIAVIAKYNVRMAPVMTAADKQADSLIDTYHASCGATVADFGETLGEDYVQQTDDGHNHLSADGIIDASTALFPDYTWFVKNAVHETYVAYNEALLHHVCDSDHQPDVFENMTFPQFTYYSPSTGITAPLTEDTDESADLKPIERVMAFFQRIVAFWRNLFERLFPKVE